MVVFQINQHSFTHFFFSDTLLGWDSGNQRFSTLTPWTLCGEYLFASGECLVHFRILSGIPGLYQPDANSTLFPGLTNKIGSRYCQISPGRRGSAK